MAERKAAQQGNSLVERSAFDDDLQRPRVHGQRVERRGEQEQRQRGQGYVFKVLPAVHVRGGGHAGAREREGDKQRAGSARTAQTECTRPIASITTTKATAYRPPLITAQPTCPITMSAERSGVASIAS